MARRTKGSGSVFKPKRSRFWWISYLSNGKRQFESSKSTRKGDAQALLLHRIGDINHGLPVTPKMGRTTVGDGLRTVVNDLRLNGRKAVLCGRCKIACCGVEGHSHEAARRIARIQAHFPAHRLLGTISTSDLMAYAAQRLSQGAAAASVNHELGMIRRAFRLAIRARELAVMPHIPMLALNNARQGFLDADQLDDIVAHLPSSLHAPVRFAFITGWRMKSEVLPLTVDRVDLRAGVVRLDVGATKNKEGRSFYLTTELRELLTTQLETIAALRKQKIICPFVFHRHGRPIKDFRKSWQNACIAAGHPGKLLHDFRRSAVRTLDRAGVPRTTAMKMVGHKTEAIYRRYSIQDEATLREGAHKLDAYTADQRGRQDKSNLG